MVSLGLSTTPRVIGKWLLRKLQNRPVVVCVSLIVSKNFKENQKRDIQRINKRSREWIEEKAWKKGRTGQRITYQRRDENFKLMRKSNRDKKWKGKERRKNDLWKKRNNYRKKERKTKKEKEIKN